ncbi:hypothetical protein FB451DRAFT_1185873 [Mycena latifolia]|nr:hypothetical protein FB451DRAFT_1185873 [Mycena latifolia]
MSATSLAFPPHFLSDLSLIHRLCALSEEKRLGSTVMSNTDAHHKGVRVLSLGNVPVLPSINHIDPHNLLDGGGAGVLSELLILEQIMYRVQTTSGSDMNPAPCDYFEVIGGSGTGGIIALMLGRLRMSIAASISAYEKLRPKPKSGSAERFKASQLEAALRQIFREEKMRDVGPDACKTFVCAMHESNLNAGIPQLFRSYDTPQEPALDCKIWEAARATSATPGLFKPIEIGWGGVRPKYIGGCVGHNNPTSLVVAEAQQMYPSRPTVLVVSVGSGHPNTIQILRSPSLTSIDKTMKSIATDCERIHEDNARRFRGTSNTYFRFNVLQGLQGFERQHWGRSSEVSTHTRVYLGTEDVKSKLTGVVDVILTPTVHFTGREEILQEMTEYFNTGIGRPHIFLLHGLGGSGKSQIAFKFVEQSTGLPESRSSQQTIENDLVTLALAKKAGKTFQDGLLWLSHQHREWLIVFNNADDIHLRLAQYFPSGSHGNILITSRNSDLCQVAQAAHKVEQMALEEATDLLLSAAQYDIMENNNRDLGKRIVQAGAFISSSRSLRKYLDLYESTSSRIQLLHQHPPQSEYGWSVYTTWQISFQKISRQARQLLELCAFIHHDGITEELFQQAAFYKLRSRGPTRAELHEPLDFLAKFLDSSGSKWDSLKFIAVTDELARFSLIDFQATLGDITFSIHPLVHEWCRAIMKVDAPTELCMHKLIGMSLSSRKDDFRFSHRMFPHVDALLFKMGRDLSCQPNILDASFASRCLWIYHEEGKWRDGARLGGYMLQTPSLQWNEHQTLTIQETLATMYRGSGMFPQAAELDKMVLTKRRELLGEDHPDTLIIMGNLALSYLEMGQFQEAAELEKVVMSKHTEILGEDHPSTLRTMGNLAISYSKLGQFQEAAELEKVVLDKHTQLLGEDHPATLRTMGNLATRYRQMGQFQEAAELQKVALNKQTELLGEDHLNTLNTMSGLAITYSEMGQFQEAAELQKVVMSKHTEILGEDHPSTLRTMGNLAISYSKLGQFQEAAELEKVVLDKHTQLLGEDHPATLRTMGNLATRYWQMGQFQEAAELQKVALNKQTELLGEDHPNTLNTMSGLAITYSEMGQFQEAAELQKVVLNKQKELFGEDHPDTLGTMGNLAICYSKMGQFQKAAELEKVVLNKQTELLGEDHPDTLGTMGNLANCYWHMGQFPEAAELQKVVLNKQTEILGKDHPDTLRTMANLGLMYFKMGRLSEAREHQEQALSKRRPVLGDNHPETLKNIHQLAKTIRQLEGAGMIDEEADVRTYCSCSEPWRRVPVKLDSSGDEAAQKIRATQRRECSSLVWAVVKKERVRCSLLDPKPNGRPSKFE